MLRDHGLTSRRSDGGNTGIVWRGIGVGTIAGAGARRVFGPFGAEGIVGWHVGMIGRSVWGELSRAPHL